jgi:hypothetical protein
MAPTSLRSLPENDGLAFNGEPPWPPAAVNRQQAQALSEAGNPSRRPNRDVLRRYVGVHLRHMHERWQIDFPSHLTVQEAALYTGPFSLLEQRQAGVAGQWWINAHANPALRTTLARLDRFLATPVEESNLAWTWMEDDWLPDNSLLVVGRDDDFIHGVLQSRLFALWWQAHAPHHALTLVVESFPFPWRPAAPLGSLTGLQQDLRAEISRAARSGGLEQVNGAVATAYGWPADLEKGELFARLDQLHQRRAG